MDKIIDTSKAGPIEQGFPDLGLVPSKNTQIKAAASPISDPRTLNSSIDPELMNNPLFDKNSIVDEMGSGAVQNQLASNQSFTGLIRRGVGNFANTALFETLKVGGVVAGLLKNGYGMIDPNTQAKTSDIWDNSIYRYLDEVQQSNANSDFLKVYKSASYEDASAFGKLATGEWWADTFANGLGFMASMFVPGQALKSMSLGGKVLSLVEGTGELLNKGAKGIGVIDASSDLMRIGKMANTVGDTLEATRKALTTETQLLNTSIKEALAKGEDIVKYTDQLKKVNSEIAAVSKTLAETKGIFQSGFSTKWINGADNLTSSFVSGVIEASAEGYSSQHETFNNLMKSGKYTREQALEMASNKAANVFKQNIGLLMVSNLIDEALVFKWFNKSSNPESTVRRIWNSTVGLEDIVPSTLYGKVKKGANKAVNNKIVRNLAEFGTTSIKEAWEESAQKNISDNASTNSASIVDGNLANIIDGGWAGITALPDMIGKNADDAIAGAVLGGLMGGIGQIKKARVEDEMIKGIGARNKKLFGLIKARVGREGLTSTYANIYNGINFSKKFSDLEKEGKVIDGKISKEEMDKLSEDDSRRVEMALAYNTALKKGDKVAISQIEDVIITNVLMKALPQHSADTNMIDLVADELIKTFEEQHKNTNVATSVRRVAEAIKKTKESVDRVSGPIVDEFDRLLYQDRFRNTLAQIVETNKYVAVRDILSQYNLPEDYIDNYESYTAGNSSTPTYTSREEADKVKGNDYYTKVGVEETKDGNFINIFERKGIKYIQNEKGSYVKYNNVENKEEYEKSYEELKKDDRYPSLLKQNIEDQARQEATIKTLGLYDIDGSRIYKGESLQSYHKKEADRFQSKLVELYDKNKIAERREQWKKGVEERTAEQTFIDSIKPGEVYVHPLQNGYITKGEDGNFYYKNVNVNQEVLPEIIPRNGFVLDADGKAKKELDALIAHEERRIELENNHDQFIDIANDLIALPEDKRQPVQKLVSQIIENADEYTKWLRAELLILQNSSIYKDDYVALFEKEKEILEKIASIKTKLSRVLGDYRVSEKRAQDKINGKERKRKELLDKIRVESDKILRDGPELVIKNAKSEYTKSLENLAIERNANKKKLDSDLNSEIDNRQLANPTFTSKHKIGSELYIKDRLTHVKQKPEYKDLLDTYDKAVENNFNLYKQKREAVKEFDPSTIDPNVVVNKQKTIDQLNSKLSRLNDDLDYLEKTGSNVEDVDSIKTSIAETIAELKIVEQRPEYESAELKRLNKELEKLEAEEVVYTYSYENADLALLSMLDISERKDIGEGVYELEDDENTVNENEDWVDEAQSSIVQKTIGVDVEFNGEDVMIPAEGVIVDGKQAYVGKLDPKPYNKTRREYFANNNVVGRKGRIFAYNELPEEAKTHLKEKNDFVSKENDFYILIVDGKNYQKHNDNYVITTIPKTTIGKITPKLETTIDYLSNKSDGEIEYTKDSIYFIRANNPIPYAIATLSKTGSGKFDLDLGVAASLLEEYYKETLKVLFDNKVTDIEFTGQSAGFGYRYKNEAGEFIDRPLSSIFKLEDIEEFGYLKTKKNAIGRNTIKLKNGSILEVKSNPLTKDDALNIIEVLRYTGKDDKYKGMQAVYNMKKGKVEIALLSQYYSFGVRKTPDGKTDLNKQQMFINYDKSGKNGKLIIITKGVKHVFNKEDINPENQNLIKILTSITRRIDAISQNDIFNVFEDGKIVQKTGKQLMLETFTSAIVSKELPVVGIYNQYNILRKHIVEKPVEVTQSQNTQTPTITIGSPIDTTLPSDPRKIRPVDYVNAPATKLDTDVNTEGIVNNLFLDVTGKALTLSLFIKKYKEDLKSNTLREVLISEAVDKSKDTVESVSKFVNAKFDELINTTGTSTSTNYPNFPEPTKKNIVQTVKEILNILSPADKFMFNKLFSGMDLYDENITESKVTETKVDVVDNGPSVKDVMIDAAKNLFDINPVSAREFLQTKDDIFAPEEIENLISGWSSKTEVEDIKEEPQKTENPESTIKRRRGVVLTNKQAKVGINNPLDMLVNNNVIEKTDC